VLKLLRYLQHDQSAHLMESSSNERGTSIKLIRIFTQSGTSAAPLSIAFGYREHLIRLGCCGHIAVCVLSLQVSAVFLVSILHSAGIRSSTLYFLSVTTCVDASCLRLAFGVWFALDLPDGAQSLSSVSSQASIRVQMLQI
jgi:hypothetical protein